MTPGYVAWGRFGLALLVATVGAYVVLVVKRLRRNTPHRVRRTRRWGLLPTVVGAVTLGLLLVGIGYLAITYTLHADASTPPANRHS